jgi:hypothetical protein
VRGAGAAGTVSFDVTPGFKQFPVRAYGLAAGPLQAGTVSASTGNPADQEHDYTMKVPAGTKALQFTAKTDNPQAALGMVIVRIVNGQQVLVAITDTLQADTLISVPNPAPGDYLAAVITLGDAAGTTATPYRFQYTPVTAADRLGSFSATAGSNAKPGTPLKITASWSGVDPAKRYAGYVEYPLGVGTVVTIN